MKGILEKHDKSIFYNENNHIIPHKHVEREEQLDVFMFLPSDSTVLELGARYGTVSCLINRILSNKENHVAVEPDSTVIGVLTRNRDKQQCKFHIFNGVVSKRPVKFNSGGYISSTTVAKDEKDGNIATLSLDQLQQKYALKFDVIVADCEGCMGQYVEENDMSQFKMIMLEKDSCHTCDYEKMEAELGKIGFLRIRNHLNIVYRSVYINTNFLPFNILSYQVSYGTIGLFRKLGYISENVSDVIIDEKEVHTLSAHAPSKIIITNKQPLLIRGYCSPSSKVCPTLIFKCDNGIVGIINSVGQKTASYNIAPGKHELVIETNTSEWAHSVWLINVVNKSS